MDAALKPTRTYYAGLTLVTLAFLAALPVLMPRFMFNRWFDTYDARIYYKESGWAVGAGMLYRDIPSEYPPLANVLFGACRFVSDHVVPGEGRVPFLVAWVALTWLTFVAVVHTVATRVSIGAALVWLTPAAVFFALLRYDIYPTATTLLALLALRQGKLAAGALWLGITVALKGYALFLLPAFAVYVLLNRGWRAACATGALAMLPFVLGNAAVVGFAGWDGMLSPFRFHGERTNVGESTYDAFYYLVSFLFTEHPVVGGPLPMVLVAGCSLLAAALRPRTFEELVNAFLFALLGFMTFSVFYSPQYVLWVLPLVCFTSDRWTRGLAVALGWFSYLYFPTLFVRESHTVTFAAPGAYGLVRLFLFRACIVAVTTVRFGMMTAALAAFRRRPAAETAPAIEFARCASFAPDRLAAAGRFDAVR